MSNSGPNFQPNDNLKINYMFHWTYIFSHLHNTFFVKIINILLITFLIITFKILCYICLHLQLFQVVALPPPLSNVSDLPRALCFALIVPCQVQPLIADLQNWKRKIYQLKIMSKICTSFIRVYNNQAPFIRRYKKSTYVSALRRLNINQNWNHIYIFVELINIILPFQ